MGRLRFFEAAVGGERMDGRVPDCCHTHLSWGVFETLRPQRFNELAMAAFIFLVAPHPNPKDTQTLTQNPQQTHSKPIETTTTTRLETQPHNLFDLHVLWHCKAHTR